MENFKIKKSQKEPVSDAKVFIDNKDETRLYNIYSVKGRVYARAKRDAISNSKLIKPEWGDDSDDN